VAPHEPDDDDRDVAVEMKPDTEVDDSQLGVRIPTPLLAALDAERSRLAKASPGQTVTRSDVVCVLLLEGLAARHAR
jgi:hypothetical protein